MLPQWNFIFILLTFNCCLISNKPSVLKPVFYTLLAYIIYVALIIFIINTLNDSLHTSVNKIELDWGFFHWSAFDTHSSLLAILYLSVWIANCGLFNFFDPEYSALWWPKCAYITQLCLTLWDCMDYTPPGSSVHGICQTMISDSRRSSWPRDQMYISCISRIGKWFFTTELPKWERNLFFGYMYMCNWFTLLYCRN